MAYAELPDVEVDYGPIPSVDDERVLGLIDRAEAMILLQVRDLNARIADGRTSLPLVKQVVAEMVSERLRNPRGLTSFAHTEGPFTTSGTFADKTGGGFRLTERHLWLLGAPTRGAFTIIPGRSSA